VELLDGLAIKKQPLLSLEKGGFPNLAWLIRVEESTELRGHNRSIASSRTQDRDVTCYCGTTAYAYDAPPSRADSDIWTYVLLPAAVQENENMWQYPPAPAILRRCMEARRA